MLLGREKRWGAGREGHFKDGRTHFRHIIFCLGWREFR